MQAECGSRSNSSIRQCVRVRGSPRRGEKRTQRREGAGTREKRSRGLSLRGCKVRLLSMRRGGMQVRASPSAPGE